MLPGQENDHNDRYNYALLIALYTLQGIPMGLSASIPFLIQQKIKYLASAAASSDGAATAARLSYNANAIFALCSWPFSLKLLWAPIVDSCFFKPFGRRKSWLVPVQALAGLLMVGGSDFVEQQLGLEESLPAISGGTLELARNAAEAVASHPLMDTAASMNVKGVTIFFFVLYFLMATQDIAVDGWALTMLSKKNRGRGPICNSIGQNLGYFLSFVGFLALNDAESSETLWRPLLRLPSRPGKGLVSLGGFIKFMGSFMLVVTTLVAIFKREESVVSSSNNMAGPMTEALMSSDYSKKDDDAPELDASEIGLRETYHRLWAVCQLPAVRWLFVILLTYRLPTALGDNVKFLKAVEFGLSKSTTALLSPTLILPLGIVVPIVAAKIWHGHPLRQFMLAYRARLTLAPLLDMLMLWMVRRHKDITSWSGTSMFWMAVIASTAVQAIVSSLQFNAQMTFFAHRVDPAIGGSYMTLLNTAANLGGTWPASLVMYLVGRFTVPPECTVDPDSGLQACLGGRDAYFPLQIGLSVMGLMWIMLLGHRVQHIAELPDDAWRTHLLDDETTASDDEVDMEMGWNQKEASKRE